MSPSPARRPTRRTSCFAGVIHGIGWRILRLQKPEFSASGRTIRRNSNPSSALIRQVHETCIRAAARCSMLICWDITLKNWSENRPKYLPGRSGRPERTLRFWLTFAEKRTQGDGTWFRRRLATSIRLFERSFLCKSKSSKAVACSSREFDERARCRNAFADNPLAVINRDASQFFDFVDNHERGVGF